MNEEFNTNNVTPSVPTPQSLPPAPTETYTPRPVKNEQTKRSVVILVVLLVLAVLAAGVFAYLWQAQSSETSKQKSAVESAQAEVKAVQSQIAELKEIKDSTPTQTAEPASDDDLIITSAKAYLHGKVGSNSSSGDPEFSITKKNLPFATVNLSSEHGGYNCVLKKADGIWFVILCLNGEPTQDDYNQWGNFESVL